MAFTRIRDLVITSLEVSKESKIPVLYLSNPGYGKTTTVKNWADKNGYRVVSVQGSAFDRSEVKGFMVNDGPQNPSLTCKRPFWFQKILNNHEEGVPSILFLDEISAAPSDVQGSLYTLIFDREISSGEKLPDDCLVLSAANYQENLPDYFSITSPSMNRFCLVNLQPRNLKEVADEFLADEDPTENWLEFKHPGCSDEERKEVKTKLREFFGRLEGDLTATGDIDKSAINVYNQSLNEMFSSSKAKNGEVLNFISGRSLYYLYQMLIAAKSVGVPKTNEFIDMIADGLVGAGTNSFKSESILKTYRNIVKREIKTILFNNKPADLGKMIDAADGIANKIKVLSEAAEDELASVNQIGPEVVKIVNEFKATYGNIGSAITDLDEHKAAKIVSDIHAVRTMLSESENYNSYGIALSAHRGFLSDHAKVYEDVLEGKSDVEKSYAIVQYERFSSAMKPEIITDILYRKNKVFYTCSASSYDNKTRKVVDSDKIKKIFKNGKFYSLEEFFA